MKDGRTHLAHKAEHAVDLETGAVVAVTVQDADEGDTTTSRETLIEAAEQIEAVRPDGHGLKEVVGDKGYHRISRSWTLKRWASAATSPNPVGAGATGRRSPRHRPRSIGTVDAFVGGEVCVCCGSAGSAWNGPLRISTNWRDAPCYLRGHTNIRKRLLITRPA